MKFDVFDAYVGAGVDGIDGDGAEDGADDDFADDFAAAHLYLVERSRNAENVPGALASM